MLVVAIVVFVVVVVLVFILFIAVATAVVVTVRVFLGALENASLVIAVEACAVVVTAAFTRGAKAFGGERIRGGQSRRRGTRGSTVQASLS